MTQEDWMWRWRGLNMAWSSSVMRECLPNMTCGTICWTSLSFSRAWLKVRVLLNWSSAIWSCASPSSTILTRETSFWLNLLFQTLKKQTRSRRLWKMTFLRLKVICQRPSLTSPMEIVLVNSASLTSLVNSPKTTTIKTRILRSTNPSSKITTTSSNRKLRASRSRGARWWRRLISVNSNDLGIIETSFETN